MNSNAANIAYYAIVDSEQGTYPIGTGEYFASRVKSNGIWDYKRTYGTKNQYDFNKWTMTGEDIGNMHYGYVGRAAGFSENLLKTAAGAYQIYSGTSTVKWYDSYFDDPNDQIWIQYGFNLFRYGINDPILVGPNKTSSKPSSIRIQNNTFEADASRIDTSLIHLLTAEEKEKIRAEAIENANRIKAELDLE